MQKLRPGNADLDPIAVDLLNELSPRQKVTKIAIGGGIALKFFIDFRQTHDLDVWWLDGPAPEALQNIEEAVRIVAERRGLQLRTRLCSEVISYDLLSSDGKKAFSLQVAPRDIWLEPVVESVFPPIPVESLRDNIASKMTALVDRCAPRDLVDIYELIQRNIVTIEECWDLWKQKHPPLDVSQARAVFARRLAELIARTPLEQLPPDEREKATARREFFEGPFLEHSASGENLV